MGVKEARGKVEGSEGRGGNGDGGGKGQENGQGSGSKELSSPSIYS